MNINKTRCHKNSKKNRRKENFAQFENYVLLLLTKKKNYDLLLQQFAYRPCIIKVLMTSYINMTTNNGIFIYNA